MTINARRSILTGSATFNNTLIFKPEYDINILLNYYNDGRAVSSRRWSGNNHKLIRTQTAFIDALFDYNNETLRCLTTSKGDKYVSCRKCLFKVYNRNLFPILVVKDNNLALIQKDVFKSDFEKAFLKKLKAQLTMEEYSSLADKVLVKKYPYLDLVEKQIFESQIKDVVSKNLEKMIESRSASIFDRKRYTYAREYFD